MDNAVTRLALIVIAAFSILLVGLYLDFRGAKKHALDLRLQVAESYVQVVINNLRTLAEVISLLNGTNSDVSDDIIRDLLKSRPDLLIRRVPLGPLGTADPSFDPGSFSGHIELDLINRAFSGDNNGVDIHRVDGRWMLSVAQSLGSNGGSPDGVLIISRDVQHMLDRVKRTASLSGELALYASIKADNPSVGPPALVRQQIGQGPLAVGYNERQGDLYFSSSNGQIAAALVIVLLLLYAWYAEQRLRKRIAEDAFRLSSALRMRNKGVKIPEPQLAMLLPLTRALQALVEGSAPRDTDRDAYSDGEPGLVDHNGQPDAPADSMVPADIFRAYDIRGPVELFNDQLIQSIGQAVGSEALKWDHRDLVVGADGRHSSPHFKELLISGLRAAGINVIDVGTVTSPMLYFAAHHLKTRAGVMVTGSHNPPHHNGFKIMLDGETVFGEQIDKIERRILSCDYASGQGEYSVASIDDAYLEAILSDVVVTRRLKVVVDCGNGAASVMAERTLKNLGCDVIALFCELDGSFPNHHPDPADVANLQSLQAEVSRVHADIGIAFDGDGDRIGVISGRGRVVAPDQLLMLLAREVLGQRPGAAVVYDVKCSSHLHTVISKAGGVPLMWRSGHSLIKQKMREIDAVLGGEFTGHICFRDRWYGFDDALYCAARLIELLSGSEKTLDERISELPHMVGTAEIRIEVNEKQKFSLARRLNDNMRFDDAQLFRFDGIRAEFEDGWGLIRPSNTSAALICRFEGRNNHALQRIKSVFSAEIHRLLPELSVPF